MPARTARRKSPPSKPRSRSGTAGPARATALTDATEDIGDMFEETLLETLARNDSDGWKAGPVVSLGMQRLTAGHLGWTATLSAPGASAVGTLHLLVVPGGSQRPPKELPLTGAQWEDFDAVEHFAGPPRLLLLAQAKESGRKTAVRQLAHEVFAHLTGDLAPERRRGTTRA